MKTTVYLLLYPPGDGLDVSAVCYGDKAARDRQFEEDLDEIREEHLMPPWGNLTIAEKCMALDERGYERPTADQQEIEIHSS